MLKVMLALGILACGLLRRNPAALYVCAPFVWLALVGLPAGRRRFPRLLLVMIAALNTLHGYPVYGTQKAWVAFPLILVAAVLLYDGIECLLTPQRKPLSRAKPCLPAGTGSNLVLLRHLKIASVAALPRNDAEVSREEAGQPESQRRTPWAWAVVAALAVGYAWWAELPAVHARYERNTPLRLPGAQGLRLDREQVRQACWLTETLRVHADTFVGLPGWNSLYFWTGLEPPTGYNPSHWTALLTPGEQQAVVSALEQAERPAVIYNPKLLSFWLRGEPITPGPLFEHIRDHFVPLLERGDWQVLMRPEHAAQAQATIQRDEAPRPPDDSPRRWGG